MQHEVAINTISIIIIIINTIVNNSIYICILQATGIDQSQSVVCLFASMIKAKQSSPITHL